MAEFDEEFGLPLRRRHYCSVCRKVGPWTVKIVFRSVTAWYCPDHAALVKERLRTFLFPAITR